MCSSDLEKIMELTEGGARSIVDFVGAEASVNFGYNLLARGGSYVVVGLFGGQLTLPLPMQALTEKKLMGSYVGPLGDMEELMELVVAGKLILLTLRLEMFLKQIELLRR